MNEQEKKDALKYAEESGLSVYEREEGDHLCSMSGITPLDTHYVMRGDAVIYHGSVDGVFIFLYRHSFVAK